ncbi:MAG TPA: hypothetical protein VEK79_08800 [Thermoanaerobaculia bacterium]|nr:hypothetical protein [Thermoanaerobaculia bacterium]
MIAFAAYFAAALLPRLSPLLAGALFADDLIHRPEGHLLSYRFLNFGELWFWELIFGRTYLWTATAKVVAALYTAGLCAVLRVVLREWGATPRVATLLPLLVPLHPLWNTFISMSAAGVYALSLLLIVLGYKLLTRPAESPSLQMAGAVLLIALGVSGYQVHVGLLPALAFAEIILSEEKRLKWLRVAAQRFVACLAAVAVYFVAIRIAALTGVKTWGGRGLALSMSEVAGGWSAMQAVTDNLGVITQPLLSFYGGVGAAWRYWWVPYLIACVLSGITFRRHPLVALLTLALPISAASVVIALNIPTSGARVTGAVWLAALLAILPILQSRRWAMTVLATLFIAIALPVTITDARNRTFAWKTDQATVAAIPKGMTVELYKTDVVPSEWHGRPIVMQNFEPVTPFDYSNVVHNPEWLLQWSGFRTVAMGTAMPRPATARSELAEWRVEPSERRVLLAPYQRQH